jgi:carboxyl-terminal processing protease
MTMSRLKTKILAGIAAAVLCGFFIIVGCATVKKTAPPPPATSSRLTPGPNDMHIAYMTARLMEDVHYSHQPLDEAMSEKFFDDYLAALDPRRVNFLQSDIDEFAHFRTNLDGYTLGHHGRTDLTPAYVIFKRFEQRLIEHTAYADQLLKNDRFKFNTDGKIQIDRRHAAYPQDLDQARQLWRQQVRYEFLQDKLSREISPTNHDTILPLSRSAEAEITDHLIKHYDWNLHAITNWDGENVLSAYLNALTHAYDPHSDYLNPESAQTFSISMSLSLFGIGATLGEDDGYCTIQSLVPGGPAEKSKQLKPKDRIVAVAQSNQPPVNVVDMDLPRVVEMIRGPKGTQVRLSIIPADDPATRRVVTLVRAEIKLEDQEAKAELIETPDGQGGTNRLGIIDLPSFYATIPMPGNEGHSSPKLTSVDVAKLLQKLEQEKVNGIILDLRNNPGGSLEEAIQFTGLFIKEGPVVLVKSSDGSIVEKSIRNSAALYTGPLVVLVNHFSASAAEIVAAALQDYGRAVIVGDTSTHGKGTVQNLTSLRSFVWPATPTATNDPGTLKVTISKFYRVTGASTQLKGVVPDIQLPDLLNHLPGIGEKSLENPLPWDTIQSVGYDKLNLVAPYITMLRQRSEARVATNQDFIYIRQDIDRFEKSQEDKTATLNEAQAIRERQADDARSDARAAERAMRPLRDEKIYDITVENAGKPGLPPPEPLISTNAIASLIATNANGSVSVMTTNNDFVVGIPLNRFDPNAAPVGLHSGEVVTQPAPDPTLSETEHILEDYISAMDKSAALMVNK